MIIVYLYNSIVQKMERYTLELYDPMPYTSHHALSVGEFRAESKSSILWTTMQAMEAWTALCVSERERFIPHTAFRRICEGGHTCQSQHYAGLAFDFGQAFTPLKRSRLYASAAASRFSYLEEHPDGSIHTDRRYYGDMAPHYGYPSLSPGSVGVYVIVLQDALYTIGITGSALDGFYGPLTERSVRVFQQFNGLPATGVTDQATWRQLTSLAAGAGQTGLVPHLS